MSKWALISVFDKRGIVEFSRQIEQAGYRILSTGGTARHLLEAGLPVTQVEDYTGFPEMMDGRVKTLHPKIHGGLLGLRDNPEHVQKMEEHHIEAIDLVVVNLYPFTDTIAKPGVAFEEAVEMIDIGGPSMLRAAAKNHRFCMPVIDPEDYAWIGEALSAGKEISDSQRISLAAKVFAQTANYDAAIAAYLEKQAQQRTQSAASAAGSAGASAQTDSKADAQADKTWPALYQVSFVHKQALRYGENPHQKAHFYAEPAASRATISGAVQLQGKELSYNNIQDADAALNILRSFDDLKLPAVVAVKHMNPCGIGLGESIMQAFERAYEADPVSIFGGIVAPNRPVDGPLAEKLTGMFLEIVMAPSFSEEAKALFARKKNVRLLELDMTLPQWSPEDKVFRRVSGGLLVQEVDRQLASQWDVVTNRAPSDAEQRALQFAWRVVKFVKSNAIVLATEHSTLGIGAGQMNRVGAAKIAIEQAGERAKGSVLASDAFFPMRDTVDTAAAAGITAIVQPGGSIKDAESISAANEHGIAMVFTGERHFLH
ncbi:bifunctional phosphoribosylaminoimidazolecarboxamide formyltransferase/IMP cyclohydrolase [Alicyclobacillus tolerans]|uniref:bifunctional phosphoribosylaminoimidazolecarboxamide formyltransferase/IMP cyclohydrolase n=1 Tax=Alicyclobacillus tolerans TaxID=90970 RepID=UPI001EFFEE5F|nr:bifunctional phosphoribosylaminoimidazolecarboxamide formyltransferase/IMP cyclohydrolase [Alicyclobacillus tolerans]MCF8566321.1 bifunctional phosphoribosylaminoimidazolecarboxamide formyltransferase/IMP cyclohydrolase [Alicyclobacillus tolerans]